MSGGNERWTDRVESWASRIYYSLNEEDFNIWAVLNRYYHFRDHRKVLFGINLLLTVTSVLLTGYASYLSYLFYDEYYYTVWLTWTGMGILFILFAAICIVGMRGAHLVSLDHLLTYFWGVVIFTGPLLLGVIACLDFYDYMFVWFKHQWELDNFTEMRSLFCSTYEDEDVNAVGKCGVPLWGGTEWCSTNYNATDCSTFRDRGIADAVEWSRQITLAQAVICAVELLLVIINLALCHRIITDQVLTQSMNEVINYLLILPIGACVGLAS
jgi:hypothetical protein